MEYVNILSMVFDTDKITTKDLEPLFTNVPTQYFVDSSRLSDTHITNQIDYRSFISVYKDEDLDCVKLEYYYEGKGSIKSCKKKIEIEFVSHILEDLAMMETDHPTTISDDICCSQLCMIVTAFELKRDPIDYNQVHSNQIYCNGYFLRKNQKGEFILETQINNLKPKTINNYQLNTISKFNKLPYHFQHLLSNNNPASFIEQTKQLEEEEIEQIEELKNLYDFEDVDYDEDDTFEEEDEFEQNDIFDNEDGFGY